MDSDRAICVGEATGLRISLLSGTPSKASVVSHVDIWVGGCDVVLGRTRLRIPNNAVSRALATVRATDAPLGLHLCSTSKGGNLAVCHCSVEVHHPVHTWKVLAVGEEARLGVGDAIRIAASGESYVFGLECARPDAGELPIPELPGMHARSDYRSDTRKSHYFVNSIAAPTVTALMPQAMPPNASCAATAEAHVVSVAPVVHAEAAWISPSDTSAFSRRVKQTPASVSGIARHIDGVYGRFCEGVRSAKKSSAGASSEKATQSRQVSPPAAPLLTRMLLSPALVPSAASPAITQRRTTARGVTQQSPYFTQTSAADRCDVARLHEKGKRNVSAVVVVVSSDDDGDDPEGCVGPAARTEQPTSDAALLAFADDMVFEGQHQSSPFVQHVRFHREHGTAGSARSAEVILSRRHDFEDDNVVPTPMEAIASGSDGTTGGVTTAVDRNFVADAPEGCGTRVKETAASHNDFDDEVFERQCAEFDVEAYIAVAVPRGTPTAESTIGGGGSFPGGGTSLSASIACGLGSVGHMGVASAALCSEPLSDAEAVAERCPVCQESLAAAGTLGVIPSCSHAFCFNCIAAWARITNHCCLCKVEFTELNRVQRTWLPSTSGQPQLGVEPAHFIDRILSREAVVCRRQRMNIDEAEERALAWDIAAEDGAVEDADGYNAAADDDTPADTDDGVASAEENQGAADCACNICGSTRDGDVLLLCDGCDGPWHTYCLPEKLSSVPDGRWLCPPCTTLRATSTDFACLSVAQFSFVRQQQLAAERVRRAATAAATISTATECAAPKDPPAATTAHDVSVRNRVHNDGGDEDGWISRDVARPRSISADTTSRARSSAPDTLRVNDASRRRAQLSHVMGRLDAQRHAAQHRRRRRRLMTKPEVSSDNASASGGEGGNADDDEYEFDGFVIPDEEADESCDREAEEAEEEDVGTGEDDDNASTQSNGSSPSRCAVIKATARRRARNVESTQSRTNRRRRRETDRSRDDNLRSSTGMQRNRENKRLRDRGFWSTTSNTTGVNESAAFDSSQQTRDSSKLAHSVRLAERAVGTIRRRSRDQVAAANSTFASQSVRNYWQTQGVGVSQVADAIVVAAASGANNRAIPASGHSLASCNGPAAAHSAQRLQRRRRSPAVVDLDESDDDDPTADNQAAVTSTLVARTLGAIAPIPAGAASIRGAVVAPLRVCLPAASATARSTALLAANTAVTSHRSLGASRVHIPPPPGVQPPCRDSTCAASSFDDVSSTFHDSSSFPQRQSRVADDNLDTRFGSRTGAGTSRNIRRHVAACNSGNNAARSGADALPSATADRDVIEFTVD